SIRLASPLAIAPTRAKSLLTGSPAQKIFTWSRSTTPWLPGDCERAREAHPGVTAARRRRATAMTTNEGTPALGEEQAREIINHWGDGGFFRLKNMGDKIFVDQITCGVAYTIRLQTHYEQRQVRQVAKPYLGGSVDDRGQAPDRWEVPVK